MRFKVILEKDDIEDYEIPKSKIKDCQEYVEACLDDYLYDEIADALRCWVENNLECFEAPDEVDE